MITRDDLSDKDLLIPPTGDIKTTVIKTTSGTSGGKPITVIRRITPFGLVASFQRVIIAFGALSTYLSQTLMHLYAKSNPCESMLHVFAHDLELNLDPLFADFKPDSMVSTTSFILRILDRLPNRKTRLSIKTVIQGGELLSGGQRALMKMGFPNARILGLYTANETGHIGIAFCPHLPDGAFHPADNAQIGLFNIDEDGVGDLVVSTRLYDDLKLSEYRNGDAGRLLPGPCACGKKVLFEVLGRVNFDYIKLAGATIRREECDRVAQELSAYVADYRIEAQERVAGGRIQGKLSMQVMPTAQLSMRADGLAFLTEEFSKRLFLTPTQTLAELIEKKLFLPLEISLVNHFSYQHKHIRVRLLS